MKTLHDSYRQQWCVEIKTERSNTYRGKFAAEAEVAKWRFTAMLVCEAVKYVKAAKRAEDSGGQEGSI
jgi:hypothetical protein